ncbi:hypothetical protein CRG98_041392 [Punica granatum]|uniref:Reverse transcriptase Ty1/copia-type domain-containing protein n=1 Tax=Punica granatum TaxID=22663 RepID=A0A2I0I2P5_PUNGR|nr:hypothetical protein CRG98_041392 [Punica granatum]
MGLDPFPESPDAGQSGSTGELGHPIDVAPKEDPQQEVPLTTLLCSAGQNGIITRDDVAGIQELKSHLHQHFEMKDLGPLSYFLGLEVTCGKDGYYLSQIKYASDLLSRAQFTDSKVTSRLLDYNVELTPANGILLSTISWLKVSYTVAGLLWLRRLLTDIGIHHVEATTLQCDNQSSLQIAHNDVFHERTKHIETDVTLSVSTLLMVWFIYNTSLRRNNPLISLRNSSSKTFSKLTSRTLDGVHCTLLSLRGVVNVYVYVYVYVH